ncbi:recombinase family protein [Clostridium boliviensis]|uniref:Recombinase family protein n=1 Tax=Clostridium boliviensis TaxID=318465 RepID=A0ABU4GMJ5_9CLOT|nr:recombinase family protein [Clostridium boliviensis]MDW2798845.1 recombinase family protein [Clostridium boliviensis]
MQEVVSLARPNRNNRDIMAAAAGGADQGPIYNAAVYARLSIEDNGHGNDSIENQIELLKRYINEQEELKLSAVFYDNGMTGTNFCRPAFTAMLEEIKKGNVNCIVVKDLSRFGRNYMEAGTYLEKIFPFLGVRFISVNDHYDSISVTSNEALAVSLKNVYHHIYAKDISRKICTVFEAKKKQGQFLGRFAPYGYKKSEKDIHRLEIEEETAGVVRRIFQMRLKGTSAAAIARFLNDQGAASYHRLLYERGLIKGTRGEAKSVWSGGSVMGILRNPVYCGCMVERKSESAYYKGGQMIEIPRDEWNYIEDTQEAIIDQITFKKVQQLIENSRLAAVGRQKQTNDRERTENVLKGLLVCGYCKNNMIRDSGYYGRDGKLIRHRFYCSGKYRKNESCKSASKVEEDLLISVFYLIKAQSELLAGTFIRGNHKMREREEFQEENPELQMFLINKKERELYCDYKRRHLSETAYVTAQRELESRKRQLERPVIPDVTVTDSDLRGKIRDDKGKLLLSREHYLAFFHKIEVYNGWITVNYAFQDELIR